MHSMQITLRDVRRSTALSGRIREKCEQLERLHPHVRHCRVNVAQSTGRGARHLPFVVTLRVSLPGEEVVVEREHLDPFLALREAFRVARRRVKEAAVAARGE